MGGWVRGFLLVEVASGTLKLHSNFPELKKEECVFEESRHF